MTKVSTVGYPWTFQVGNLPECLMFGALLDISCASVYFMMITR